MSSNENRGGDESHAVHFASKEQQIDNEAPAATASTNAPAQQNASSQQQFQMNQLTEALGETRLQSRRASAYHFEPISLPASRVPSHTSSRNSSRHNSQANEDERLPTSQSGHFRRTQPLTPAVSDSKDLPGGGARLQEVDAHEDTHAARHQITPPVTSTPQYDSSRPGSSGNASRAPSRTQSGSEQTESTAVPSYRKNAFAIGPSTSKTSDATDTDDKEESSVPASREGSPNRSAYSRPFTPAGEPNDPYASNRRPPQSRNLDNIEPRFVFSGLSSRAKTSPAQGGALPRPARSTADLRGESKKHHTWGRRDPSHGHLKEESHGLPSRGSMAELKRFLKIGGSNRKEHAAKRIVSPSPSIKPTKTPSSGRNEKQLPFGDDHGLTSRYGKLGKVLGAGAGGSVRLMKRSSDGTTFAVKEFRARHNYETEREYAKKVTAEFCIGSTLHHGNVIETLDIIQEKGRWYEVMEYAPYDLFAIVMTGKMSREEVSCSFLQILSGVTYLHSMGLAHRDLKLDNVVVNEFGIMKIIDFGSASMFKYPFETEIVLSSGIVGSDPYLAPEVYDERKYDPQPADIWSLAIIFCCMSLRRFPWKMPRMTDNSYKLFASAPTPGTDIRRSTDGHAQATPKAKSETELAHQAAVAAAIAEAEANAKKAGGNHSHSHSQAQQQPHPEAEPVIDSDKASINTEKAKPIINGGIEPVVKKPEVIKGPWRLLRLLPRETRHIIGRMLEIDPKKRATMAEILEDPWVANTIICRQDIESGVVVPGPDHTHTLEPPAAAPQPAK